MYFMNFLCFNRVHGKIFECLNCIFYVLFFRLLVGGKRRDAQIFLVLSTIGHYSLFPLIFTPFGKHSTHVCYTYIYDNVWHGIIIIIEGRWVWDIVCHSFGANYFLCCCCFFFFFTKEISRSEHGFNHKLKCLQG
jgi:hypothetical protein